MAAATMKAGIDVLSPYLKVERSQIVGTVVIGTVKGDVHDIGKNLVSIFLTSAGFQVIDLGVDIPAETFINEVKKNSADILAMSAPSISHQVIHEGCNRRAESWRYP
jgi:5-methyltetrahydrofolate--homocysteine methyltransferase